MDFQAATQKRKKGKHRKLTQKKKPTRGRSSRSQNSENIGFPSSTSQVNPKPKPAKKKLKKNANEPS